MVRSSLRSTSSAKAAGAANARPKAARTENLIVIQAFPYIQLPEYPWQCSGLSAGSREPSTRLIRPLHLREVACARKHLRIKLLKQNPQQPQTIAWVKISDRSRPGSTAHFRSRP